MNHQTPPSSLLPDDLVWAAGGHASDVVLTALADGQHDIVPEAVRAHVDTCTECTVHLGHAALLSLRAERELRPRALTARLPLPKRAILAGLAVALLGLAPSLGRGAPLVPSSLLPTLARTLAVVARRLGEPGSVTGIFVSYATALVLVVTAFVVVRRQPRKEMSS